MGIDIAIKQKLFQLAEIVHLRVFGHAMGDEMRKFLGNLSWSFFGGIIASVIMLLVGILAAKFLGPAEFGKYNLVLSLAMLMYALFLFGNDLGSLRLLSEAKELIDKKRIFSSSLFLFFLQSLLILGFFLTTTLVFDKYFFAKEYFLLVCIFGFVLGFKSLVDTYFRSLGFYKMQTTLKILDPLVVSIVVFLCYFSGIRDYSIVAYGMIVGGVIFLIPALLFFRKLFVFPKINTINHLIKYNIFFVTSVAGGILISLDKYFIGRYIGKNELGLFSVYCFATFVLMSMLSIYFMNVFLPLIIKKKENLKLILEKLVRIIFLLSAPWVILTVILTAIIFSIVGNEYSFSATTALLFSLAAFSQFLFNTQISILSVFFVRISAVISLISAFFVVLPIIIFRDIDIYLLVAIAVYLSFSVFILMMMRRMGTLNTLEV